MSKKNKRLMKQLSREATPARTALLGLLGGAAAAWFGRRQLEAGIEKLRSQRPQPAE